MKTAEREKAIGLRKLQWTYSEIAECLKVSKGTLSHWLRDVPYTPRQEALERAHLARIRNGQVLAERKATRISAVRDSAKRELPPLDRSGLRLLGAMAYWTEGSKTNDSIVKFTNTDPDLILLILRWLKEVCSVLHDKLRLHLRVHWGEEVAQIEQFWSDQTGIPRSQFYRTTLKESGSGGRTFRKVRYGIASLIVCDTNLFYRIQGWVDGIKGELIPRSVVTPSSDNPAGMRP